ncbi:MAG: iron chaperone [Thermoleophilia bacterium]
MAGRSTATSIDEYIAEFPPETQRVLREVRDLVKATAPQATETISYAIPTFDLNGHLVHFAAYENHLGFYPAPSGIAAFREELKPYKRAKGSVQFPLGRPLPMDLIRRVVEFRVAENTGKAAGKAASAAKPSATKPSATKPSAGRRSAGKTAAGKTST